MELFDAKKDALELALLKTSNAIFLLDSILTQSEKDRKVWH